MAPQNADIKRRHPIQRLGCGLLLICWFILLMTPCALFYLAANGEIRLWHRNEVPQADVYPLLLISLVSAVDHRGLRIENSSIALGGADENALCMQTHVRFVLWQSDENSQDASYCDCYQRDDAAAAWQLDRTFGGDCQT